MLYGEVFKNAFLDLLQSVVILFEYFLRRAEIFADLGFLFPWHIEQPINVISHHRGLGGHGGHHLKLIELGLRLVARLLGHAGLFDLLRQLFSFVRHFFQVAQFLLDGLHLFVQVILALALFHLAFYAAADAFLHLE